MKKNIMGLSIAALFAIHSNADFIGLNVGAAYWGADISGTAQYKGSNINLANDLGYGDNMHTNFIWASFEHPVPLLPNIKIQHTKIDDTASQSNTITFNNTAYTGTISSSIKLDQTDFILYYEILDNWVNLDLGANFKYVDASVSLDSALQTKSTKDLNIVIPMLYAKAQFDLPFTGLSFDTDISYLGYSGNQYYDFKAGLTYETSYGLGVTTGYREQKLKLDDISDVTSDIAIKGIYAGLFYHF